MQALAWSPDGALYAGRCRSGGGPNQLYTLNPWTGAAEYVYDLSLPGDTGIRGMAISAQNQAYILAASDFDSQLLCRVDLGTGELLGSVALAGEYNYAQGLAFGPNGTLYGVAAVGGAGLYTLTTIDPDGQTHIVGQHPQTVNVSQSIAFTPDGRLFGLGQEGSVPNFSELDPADGSLIGPAYTISGDLRGLEYVPEPGTLSLLLLGALGLRRRLC